MTNKVIKDGSVVKYRSCFGCKCDIDDNFLPINNF